VDLMDIDSARATDAQAVSALRFLNEADPSELKWPLHRAAASGAVAELGVLLDSQTTQSTGMIDGVNNEGDTPLILSCRYGQRDAALLLLQRGADATIRNSFGENALHYAWCFNTRDGPDMIRKLANSGASVYDISIREVPVSDFDILPVLPGTPIERAAGRIRLDLVRVFISLGSLSKPLSQRYNATQGRV
jgi:ankyrin repeat protein